MRTRINSYQIRPHGRSVLRNLGRIRVYPIVSSSYGPGSSTVFLSWDMDLAPAVTEYKLHFGSFSGSSNQGTLLTGSTATSIMVTKLTGIYYIRVESVESGVPTGRFQNELVMEF